MQPHKIPGLPKPLGGTLRFVRLARVAAILLAFFLPPACKEGRTPPRAGNIPNNGNPARSKNNDDGPADTSSRLMPDGNLDLIPYKIQPGDTLWNLCRGNRNIIQQVAYVNGIRDPADLQAGETIFLPKKLFEELRRSCDRSNNWSNRSPSPKIASPDPDQVRDKALDFILEAEGGINRDPKDKANKNGCITNCGITVMALADLRDMQEFDGFVNKFGFNGLSDQEILEQLKEDSAIYVYQVLWKHRMRRFPTTQFPKTAIALFDAMVNSGAGTAVKLLQQVVDPDGSKGTGLDGIFGPKTEKAMMEFVKRYGEEELVDRFIEDRQRHYRTRSQFSRYGRGWLNRLEALRHFLKELSF